MATAPIRHPLSRDERDILAVIEAVNQAHYNKDAAALVAQYDPDAVLFDLAPPLSRSIDLQEKKAWLATWEGPVEREWRDFDFTVKADFAVGHGFYRLSGTPKMAGKQVSFWMRATVCLRRDAGTWRIVHEHESVPFYMDGSLRPAFDLKPE